MIAPRRPSRAAPRSAATSVSTTSCGVAVIVVITVPAGVASRATSSSVAIAGGAVSAAMAMHCSARACPSAAPISASGNSSAAAPRRRAAPPRDDEAQLSVLAHDCPREHHEHAYGHIARNQLELLAQRERVEPMLSGGHARQALHGPRRTART